MQWAQALAPAEPTEMDVENTPAQASIEEVPAQEFQSAGPHDHMEQSPAAPPDSSMGYEPFQGSEAETPGAGDAMQAVETHYEEQVHYPEQVPAEAAAASFHVPSPLVAHGGADLGQQGSEQRKGTPATAPAPQLSPGQAGQQQVAPAHMEVDEVPPASSAPFSLGEVGGQDLAERLAEDAHREKAAAAATAVGTQPAEEPVQAPSSEPNQAPAADRPIQAPSSEPNEAAATDRPIQAPCSEPDKAPAADRPMHAPPTEPNEAMAERPVQASSFEEMHVTAAADSHRLGSPAAFEERQREDPEEACEQAAGTPLAYVRRDGVGVEARGDISGREAPPGAKESIELHGKLPAVPTSGSAGPATTGTPRVCFLSPKQHDTAPCDCTHSSAPLHLFLSIYSSPSQLLGNSNSPSACDQLVAGSVVLKFSVRRWYIQKG